MLDLLHQLTFLERGIIAGLIVGFICPIIGAFLLVRRMTIISEGLSHITLTGIAVGIVMMQSPATNFINPLYTGVLFSLIGSLLVEKLRQIYRHFQELAIPIILSAGIGLSALLISISPSNNTEWFNYLFGSIVTVTLTDLLFIVVTGIVMMSIVLLFYKELLSISFDQEFAITSGISVKKMNFLFSILIALVISMSMKVIGILLVGAMVTLPVAVSIQFAKSFRQVVFIGIIVGEISVIGGIIMSIYFNIATGGMIVVTGVIILIISVIIKRSITFLSFKSVN
ncbi:metal ABC transporter permease [Salipaludibacillus agaradhaerens]|uniref:Metal ABC transporter permease n=1 Tax=Salipaludibacillus agaradhaerens TaxID=76935 RepID=A0A9Q4FXJ3_SALAG|nr:metal ABC transporter permease [Salipaludibacillus agaradhaerens]MCR6096750.1 metal ABC transporter permease [Salipaludibacillus agaradhaerens]MCR6113691.1 metal ABC transporter permease [Salipaludibacillus agaradhaerens]UJW57486.1 metal ABC transporter permease [Bacillus sp. A116_S68]